MTQSTKCRASKYFFEKMKILLLIIVIPVSCELYTDLFFVEKIENNYTMTTLNGFVNDEFVLSFLILSTGVSTTSIIAISDKNDNIFWNLDIKNSHFLKITLTNDIFEIQITANTWSSIVFSQFFISHNNIYNYSIAVNGTVQFSKVNTQPMVFTDLILYTFFNCLFNPSLNIGSIKNLSIYSQTQVFWSQWSEWSQCNSSFIMTKTRYCSSNQWLNCVGNNSKVKSCSNQVFWAQWSDWSNCSNSYGFMNRTRECIDLSIVEWSYSNQSELLEYSEFFIMEKTTLLSKGNLIAIIKRLNKEYSMSFEFNPTSIKNVYGNVIHLTIENDMLTYGDRIPAVFFLPGISGLKICAAINNILNNCLNKTFYLKLGIWSSFKISQELFEGKYIYSIKLNNETLLNVENQDAREFSNVKVYVSDPWYDVQPGYIRNLKITNGNPGTQFNVNSSCNFSEVMNKSSECNSPSFKRICDGHNFETIECLALWSQWSKWSCCNATSVTTRSRNCSNTQLLVCKGDYSEVKTCNISFIGVEINAEKNQQQYEPYNITISIFYCSDVQLILSFGDGTTITNIKNINASTAKGYIYSTIHSYSVCQQFTITANIFENAGNTTSALFTSSINVTVFCFLSPLKVIKTPPDSLAGYVQLSLNKNITLSIYQKTGSNMIYSIDWGDGYSTANNQTLNSRPVSFQVQHMYKNINNYTISVACRNYLQTLSPIFIQVQVTNCSMPEIHFYYGTVYNPMNIIKNVGRDLTAFVESVSSFCKNETFTFEWKLASSDFKSKVTQQKGILSQQKVTYSIAKNSLDYGVYILSLQCNYGDASAVYTAYLNVIFSPLYIEIDKGLFVSVAYKKKVGNESFYQNFQVSAMSSYDPDDPTIGTQNITFRWRCKIASNFSDAKVAMENFTLLNFTFLSDTCFNKSWADISSTFSEIVFSTQQFLEDVSYHIEVCGTKYAGKDVFSNDCYKTSCFIQEVLISGSFPTVAIKCISNCDTKLNFKERMVYSFNCEDCGYRRLEANWTVEDEAGYFPAELSVQNATSTGFLIPSLVINKDILLESKNYTFTLMVGYANSVKKVKLKFKKSTCSQPTPGYCIINPAEGVALETKFVLICDGWRDSDGLLSYAFYYDNGQSQQIKLSSVTSIDYPILNAGTTDQPSLLNFVMGPGDENNDFKIRIIIKVIGKYQAYTEYDLYIKVYPNNKPSNFKSLIANINVNETQSVANLVQAVSNNINKNFANQYNITASSANELFGMIDEDTLKQQKQQELSGLQELRTQLIDLMNNLLLDDLNSFKSISDALVVTTQNPLEIVPHAQNQAASIVDKLARLFTKKNLKGFGAEKFETISQSFVNSISNLLQLTVPTPSLNYVQNVRMKDVVYTWDTIRSQNIRTETQSLFFSGSNGLPINVSNRSHLINMTIKNKPETMKGENISLSMPNEVYQVSLSIASGCKLLLKFIFANDEKNLTNLIIYIQYGKVATKLDYDIMLNVSIKQGVVMTKNYNLTKTAVLNLNNNTNQYSTKVLQRNQDVLLLDDGAIMLWNFDNSTYSFLNKSELHLMFLYSGPMPAKKIVQNPYNFDETEYFGKFDYEMKSFCVECNYWNEDANKWMSDGCQLDVHQTSFLMTKCRCNHLTTFGGFFVAPNRLPTISISKIRKGYVLLVAVVTVISLWLLGLLFTRRLDRKDISKIGVCPLADNRDEDTYLYQIIVNTGTRRNAGTKSSIFFNIVGNLNDSGVRHLKDPERECFQRSSCDMFIMAIQSTLGDLDFIHLWHDNSGGGWYVKNIIIIDLQTEKRFVFIGHCWIAVDRGMCKLDCVLPVASFEESTNSLFVFKNKAQHKLHNEHLWFSIFFRSPKSNFTRCQRLSVAVSLIMTSMMVSTMFYQRVPQAAPAIENKDGNFIINLTQVFVVLVSTCIKFPVNFILVKLFCSIRNFPRNDSHNCLACDTNNIDRKESCACVHLLENNHSQPNKKKMCISFEKCKLYIAWFICAGNIFSCGIIIFWYGIAFGNQKSLNWLACVTIDFVKSILVLDPLKIFVVVFVMVLVVKKIDDETANGEVEKQGKRLAFDENWLHKPKDKLKIDSDRITMQPLDYSTVKKMRETRLKHQKMHTIVTELFLFIFYACLVLFLGYFSRGSLTFYQTRNVKELFNLKLRLPANPNIPLFHSKVFNQIQSSKDFWYWMEEFFLPQVFPEPWYNLSDFNTNTNMKDFPGKLFLNDLTSKIVNGIRIRQVRIKTNSCTKADSISKFIAINCLSPYKTALEETRGFDLNWTIPKHYNSTINTLTMPWRFQTWKELDGYPYTASLDTYYGGGYVIEIFSKWKNQVILDQAKNHRWIDRQTRAILIEFALFNGATNSFNMVTMALEFLASGGVVPNFTVLTFNLYASVSGSKVLLGFHILFILMTILITIRESRFLYRNGCKYFVEFWNLVEVALIIFCIIAVGLFFYKDYLAKVLLQRLPDKKPQVFINFQFASYCDMMYVCIVSLIVFFVTLKFIKLLQFNHHVAMISYTLKSAWYPLSMFGIVFFIILCSFVTFSNIAFGALMGEYKTYNEAIVSTVSLLLGKFSFNQYERANIVLGPLFFFGFNVVVIWIIMNIFISILNDAFSMVRTNSEFQNNDYEIVDFILECIKGWFKHRQRKPLTQAQVQSEKKFYSKSKIIQVAEYDHKRLKESDSIRKVEYKNIYDVELKNTLCEDLLSKFDYLLNESKLDNEISETIDQIFDKDLFKKFMNCMKVVYNINNKKAKRKKMNDVIIMDIEDEIF
ncbi:uncharacterized protein LOC105846743 isoform X2 [Hydra vulgaris]|uniref:uncharacterized protein LOC105846743 isoform X2 n=1 Tax=Hydra vulgaris TaxID=6087 RepID=UPI0032EA4CBC